jgi:hypothetical protein
MAASTTSAHAPTLDTVLMVESTLQKHERTYLTMAALKRLLPRKVQHGTLKRILDYLQRSGKITIGVQGILWTFHPLLRTHPDFLSAREWSPEGLREKETKRDKGYSSAPPAWKGNPSRYASRLGRRSSTTVSPSARRKRTALSTTRSR